MGLRGLAKGGSPRNSTRACLCWLYQDRIVFRRKIAIGSYRFPVLFPTATIDGV